MVSVISFNNFNIKKKSNEPFEARFTSHQAALGCGCAAAPPRAAGAEGLSQNLLVLLRGVEKKGGKKVWSHMHRAWEHQ